MSKGRCPGCSQQHDQARRPAWITTFYASTAWKKLRAMKRAQNPLCERCLGEGIVTPAAEIDHVMALAQHPERGLMITNLQSLCVAHHRAKTGRGA